MSTSTISERDFDVEHHAVLYALLAKQVIQRKGTPGQEVVLEGTRRYGRERGERMAAAALRHGAPLTPINYMVYGEWKSRSGTMSMDAHFVGERFRTAVKRCDWCDAWQKHNLMEFGKYYCDVVDASVYEGYNPQLRVEVGTLLSHGADCCTFDWGQGVTAQECEERMKAKAALGDCCIRDFHFHTVRLLTVLGDTIKETYGEEGREMVALARAEFKEIFGAEFDQLLCADL